LFHEDGQLAATEITLNKLNVKCEGESLMRNCTKTRHISKLQLQFCRTILAMSVLTIALFGCSKVLDPDTPGNLVPKTVDEDPNLPYLEINGTRLHLETMGNIADPIIIFMHGGPGGDYRPFICQEGNENASRYPSKRSITNGGLSALQDSYFCVFYDQRSAGLSPRFDPVDLSIDLYVQDLDAIIDHFLNEKKLAALPTDSQVILIGHSFGGELATAYTNAHPQKVRDIIAYEPGPFTTDALNTISFTSPFAFLLKPSLDGFAGSLKYVDKETHARSDYNQILAGGSEFMNSEFHSNPNCPSWRFGSLCEDGIQSFAKAIEGNRIVNNLSNYKGRFLYICGQLTRQSLSMAYLTTQMSYYANADSVFVSGVGHTGIWERADTVVTITRNFLSKNN